MEIRIVEEAGHYSAVTGMRFSKQVECDLQLIEEAGAISTKTTRTLANKDGGHNKFLESIMVWFDIRASLKFWKQFDTYRVGITKQSKSTMHTLMKQELTKENFDMYTDYLTIGNVKRYIDTGDFDKATSNLPEGYLQTRRVCCSYKTLRHIIKQRQGHKLKEWAEFIDFMTTMLQKPELLGEDIVQN